MDHHVGSDHDARLYFWLYMYPARASAAGTLLTPPEHLLQLSNVMCSVNPIFIQESSREFFAWEGLTLTAPNMNMAAMGYIASCFHPLLSYPLLRREVSLIPLKVDFCS